MIKEEAEETQIIIGKLFPFLSPHFWWNLKRCGGGGGNGIKLS